MSGELTGRPLAVALAKASRERMAKSGEDERGMASLTFRVPAALRDAFITAAQQRDTSGSRVLRAAMRDYLALRGDASFY